MRSGVMSSALTSHELWRGHRSVIQKVGFVVLVISVFAWMKYSPSMSLSTGVARAPATRGQSFPYATGSISDQYLIPDASVLLKYNDDQLVVVFQKFCNSIEIFCRNLVRVGSLIDGGKDVCGDSSFMPRAPCLVLSFGSNNQFSFEEDVVRLFKCEVHTFDPTLTDIAPEDLKTPPGVTFHNMGLEGWNDPDKNMFTLGNILNQLGHTQTIIDILKIDIETSEWTAIPEMIRTGSLRNVKQLVVEVHYYDIPEAERVRRLLVLQQLYYYGFRKFNREKNLVIVEERPTLGFQTFYFTELSYINLNFVPQ